MQNLQLENDFWQFSLSCYAEPGVAETCLVLQNQHEANINLLLYCLWLAKTGRSLDWVQIQQKGEIESWHRQQVLPVRQLRMMMQETSEGSQAQKYYYESLKKDELDAEQIEQAMLFQMTKQMPLIEAAGFDNREKDSAGVNHLALANLEKYAQGVLPASTEIKPLLDKLVQFVI